MLAGPDHVRSILGGLLVQDLDDQAITPADWTVASQRPPTPQEKQDLEFAGAWCVTCAPTPSLWPSDGQSLRRGRRADEPRGLSADCPGGSG